MTNFDFERALNTGSIMITLYVIAATLLYIAFLREPRKSEQKRK